MENNQEKKPTIKKEKGYSVMSEIINLAIAAFFFNTLFAFMEFWVLILFLSDRDFFICMGLQFFVIFLFMCHDTFMHTD